jgi:hypothetical protein
MTTSNPEEVQAIDMVELLVSQYAIQLGHINREQVEVDVGIESLQSKAELEKRHTNMLIQHTLHIIFFTGLLGGAVEVNVTLCRC